MSEANVPAWLDEFSQVMVKATLEFITNVKKPVDGMNLEEKLTYMYVQTLIHVLVAQALSDFANHKMKDRQQQYNHTAEKLMVLKSELQNAIAIGFEDAWAQVYNQHVDYYVSIDPVPPAINKEPC